jgi:AraC family transcriptional regulator of adaptative response / DNA-3-methyladenine glycosylase II
MSILLPYQPPYDWEAMLGYLAPRAIPGMERVADGAYSRTFFTGAASGRFTVRNSPAERGLLADIQVTDEAVAARVSARLALMFDTERDVAAVAACLGSDPVLGPLLRLRPGLRSPGAWDGFELAVRAILGQQVSVAAARMLALRLVQLCGRALPDDGPLTVAFPDAPLMAATDLAALGMPASRRAALRALAEAACRDPTLFDPSQDLEACVAKLRRIRGVGEWTAHYVALRAGRCMDAFPHADLALLRAAAGPGGERPLPRALLARAEAWRPFRAYAAQHLWTAEPVPRS